MPLGAWISNVKNERTNVPISFRKQNQNVLVPVPEFVLLRTDCFDLGQNLFSWTKIDMISFDGADSGMKAHRHFGFIPVLMSEGLWNVFGKFVFNCFDQCTESGSSGSTCFLASRIRIH